MNSNKYVSTLNKIKSAELSQQFQCIFYPEKSIHESTITKVLQMFAKSKAFIAILKCEIDSYQAILNEWDNIPNIDVKIEQSVIKYNQYMLNRNITIDLDIIYLWRIHMLHPIIYQNDCISCYQQLISPNNYASIKLPIFNANTSKTVIFQQTNINKITNKQKFTEFKFKPSIIKNIKFMKTIISNLNKSDIDHKFIENYQLFLGHNAKIQANANIHISPMVTQDFAWHTHLLFPLCYISECKSHTYPDTMIIDHNDLLNGKIIQKRKEFCDEYWNTLLYSRKKDFLNPDHKSALLKWIIKKQKNKENAEILMYGYIDRKYNIPHDVYLICVNYYYVPDQPPYDRPVKHPPRPKYYFNYGC